MIYIALYLACGAVIGALYAKSLNEEQTRREWWWMVGSWSLVGTPLVIGAMAFACVRGVNAGYDALHRWSGR